MILRCQNTFWEKKNFSPLEIPKHLEKFQCILAEWVRGGVWLKNNMCSNGLKWLETHFKTMFVFYKKVWNGPEPPPPLVENFPLFYFFFFEGFPKLFSLLGDNNSAFYLCCPIFPLSAFCAKKFDIRKKGETEGRYQNFPHSLKAWFCGCLCVCDMWCCMWYCL